MNDIVTVAMVNNKGKLKPDCCCSVKFILISKHESMGYREGMAGCKINLKFDFTNISGLHHRWEINVHESAEVMTAKVTLQWCHCHLIRSNWNHWRKWSFPFGSFGNENERGMWFGGGSHCLNRSTILRHINGYLHLLALAHIIFTHFKQTDKQLNWF